MILTLWFLGAVSLVVAACCYVLVPRNRPYVFTLQNRRDAMRAIGGYVDRPNVHVVRERTASGALLTHRVYEDRYDAYGADAAQRAITRPYLTVIRANPRKRERSVSLLAQKRTG